VSTRNYLRYYTTSTGSGQLPSLSLSARAVLSSKQHVKNHSQITEFLVLFLPLFQQGKVFNLAIGHAHLFKFQTRLDI
jgi:hypothetical protein